MNDAPMTAAAEPTHSESWLSFVPALLSMGAVAKVLWQRFPNVYQEGAVWAEAGQLYFPQAHTQSIGANLVALDYGYVPLWCRLWALVVSWLGVHPAHTAHAYNAIALVVAAGCSAVFALPHFRKLMPSDVCRVLVCLGFAFTPDFDTKTFINVSYYPAIVCYLVLVMAVRAETVSLRLGLAGALGLGISMLSKPHYMAFAPGLLVLLGMAAWRKSRGLAVMASVPLLAIGVQFAVLFANRATVAPERLALFKFLALLGRWVLSAVRNQMLGQAALAATTVKLVAATAFVAIVARSLFERRHELKDLLWPVVLGMSLLVSGVTLGIVSFPSMYMHEDPQYLHSLLQIRHFFVPMAGMYLTLALIIGQVRGRLLQPVTLALWLSVAFPFGFIAAPGAPTWPVVGYSAWSPLAHKIFDKGAVVPARGCIPIDPYPRMMALDCQLLEGMDGVTELMHRRASTLKDRYDAPAAAQDWLVDTVGMRVLNMDAGTQQLVAYDAQGVELGRAQALVAPAAALSYFNFSPPLAAVATVAVVDTAMQPSSLVMDGAQEKPMWVWFGRETQATP